MPSGVITAAMKRSYLFVVIDNDGKLCIDRNDIGIDCDHAWLAEFPKSRRRSCLLATSFNVWP